MQRDAQPRRGGYLPQNPPNKAVLGIEMVVFFSFFLGAPMGPQIHPGVASSFLAPNHGNPARQDADHPSPNGHHGHSHGTDGHDGHDGHDGTGAGSDASGHPWHPVSGLGACSHGEFPHIPSSIHSGLYFGWLRDRVRRTA